MKNLFNALFNGPVWRTFLLMGVFGWLFAFCSYNLLMLSKANLDYIGQYGLMALMEGGLRQMVELIAWGYLGLAFYILFKGCLYGLLKQVSPH